MAKVLLAGYNVDRDVLDEVVGNRADPPPLTPETVSAAYARISRDPRPVTELRKDSCEDVARARRSMSTIVFKYGHHSVAEHAAFNFDILDVSRLAVESIERHRLASYTEKSQRYIRLGEDFVVPVEVREAGLDSVTMSIAASAGMGRCWTACSQTAWTRAWLVKTRAMRCRWPHRPNWE
ncbi:MAG: FAD-dependent thymidylate synthase [Deltaproteobacteria bacterium]|nr:FAD-dependent thymidylate synthase [Deltaproteobacteria bacterium]